MPAPDWCDVVRVGAGLDYSFTLARDGALTGWGINPVGELGFEVPGFTALPLPVPTLGGITKIDGGQSHTLAVTQDGQAWASGSNWVGQLGNGTGVDSPVPVPVPGLTTTTGVAAGYLHSAVVLANGEVWTFGWNQLGELGDGSFVAQSLVPVRALLSDVARIAAGDRFVLAVKNDGTVWGWGDNAAGQLGNGTFLNSYHSPVQTSGLTGISVVAGGSAHSLAAGTNGLAWSWGANDDGALGIGNYTSGAVTPRQVINLTDVIAVAAGVGHSLALTRDGTVWAWGRNAQGQLGTGGGSRSHTPAPVVGLNSVVSIAAGRNHSLAVRSDRTVWAWGTNDLGQLGNGTRVSSPVPVLVQLDALPAIGNELRATRQGTDVRLDLRGAAPAAGWRFYADADRTAPGTTPLADAFVPGHLDPGAVLAGDLYYRVAGLSSCTLTPGPP